MGRVLLIVAIVMLTIYCTVELATSPPARVRVMPKWLWGFVIVFLPVAGPLAWLFFGRPATPPAPRRRPTVRGPDDDEDFLRGLR